jgi:ATP-dependent protease ClpP protease subunit
MVLSLKSRLSVLSSYLAAIWLKSQSFALLDSTLASKIEDEKIAELTQALLYLNEMNRLLPEGKEKKPVEFYINTYGGSADDMFAMYDVMQVVMEETEIHTIGVGKVMSAGTLLLAAGTKGKRKIGKNCARLARTVA